jgi:hypothetical protein
LDEEEQSEPNGNKAEEVEVARYDGLIHNDLRPYWYYQP